MSRRARSKTRLYPVSGYARDGFIALVGELSRIARGRRGEVRRQRQDRAGILMTQEGARPFYNFLSDEERRFFTAKPKEITA
jgi:hypothetical protein